MEASSLRFVDISMPLDTLYLLERGVRLTGIDAWS